MYTNVCAHALNWHRSTPASSKAGGIIRHGLAANVEQDVCGMRYLHDSLAN